MFRNSILTICLIALIVGCSKAPKDTQTNIETPITPDTETVTSEKPDSNTSSFGVNDLTPEQQKEQDKLLTQAQFPSKAQVAIMVKTVSKYTAYKASLGILAGTGTTIEPMSEANLETETQKWCTILKEKDGNIMEAAVSVISDVNAQTLYSKPQHMGSVMSVAVYYNCPEYTDIMHTFLKEQADLVKQQ